VTRTDVAFPDKRGTEIVVDALPCPPLVATLVEFKPEEYDDDEEEVVVEDIFFN